MGRFGETEKLVRDVKAGNPEALNELFDRHRDRLLRMIRLRLDPRLRRRVDEMDILQDVYLKAFRRLDEYLRDARVPFFVWLRTLTGQQLFDVHRHHLGTAARDPRREVSIYARTAPAASSAALAAQLVGKLTTPSQEALDNELRFAVEQALDSLDPNDREILVLRHFENLSNVEAAEELGLTATATSKRYLRALERLKCTLEKANAGPYETRWLDPRR